MERWQEEAERMGGASLAQVLAEIRDGLADNTRKTEQVLRAFPAGDTDGHRRYHEAIIEARELRNKILREALAKVVQAGFLAGFGWIALALWKAFAVSVVAK